MSEKYEKLKDAVFAVLGKKKPFVSAVILAGGVGSRMGGGERKQMRLLCGKPLIVHTLLAFERCACIHEIVLVAHEAEVGCYAELCAQYGITKLSRTVAGGNTRQQSAKLGFDAICAEADYVALHDGARALVTPEEIKTVVLTAMAHGAAIAACRASDTVKYAEGVFVDQTLDRANIWLAQTPQVFRDEIYRAAIYTAVTEGFEATDDAALVEHIGIRVRIAECAGGNFKITYPEDLRRAEAVLSEREAAYAGRTGI